MEINGFILYCIKKKMRNYQVKMKGWNNKKIDGTTDDVILIEVDCSKQNVILYAELDESGLFRTRVDADVNQRLFNTQYCNFNWNKIMYNRYLYKIAKNPIDYNRY